MPGCRGVLISNIKTSELFLISYYLFVFAVLSMEHRASHVLSWYFTHALSTRSPADGLKLWDFGEVGPIWLDEVTRAWPLKVVCQTMALA